MRTLFIIISILILVESLTAQDSVLKFDKFLCYGKFVKNGDPAYVPGAGQIVKTGQDGNTYFMDGRPYKEITRRWIQDKKIHFFTRDEINQSTGCKIWYLDYINKNNHFESINDLLEVNLNSSIGKLNPGEVVLYSYNTKIWVKLTNNACYKGRFVKIKKIIVQDKKPIKKTSEFEYPSYNKKINCDYCDNKIGRFFFKVENYRAVDCIYCSQFQFKVLKMLVNNKNIFFAKEIFCKPSCAIEFNKVQEPLYKFNRIIDCTKD